MASGMRYESVMEGVSMWIRIRIPLCGRNMSIGKLIRNQMREGRWLLQMVVGGRNGRCGVHDGEINMDGLQR